MSYIEAFKRVQEKCVDQFDLIGDVLLVEEVQPEEVKTKSGLILSTGELKQVNGIEANRPCWVRVLQVGDGFFDDDGDVPLQTQPGDICMVGKLSVKWISMLGPIPSRPEHNFGLVRESEVQWRFKGQQGYDQYFATLVSELGLNP